jgi:1,4-dihydroxy-2-naphthoate octaprenyltransferase
MASAASDASKQPYFTTLVRDLIIHLRLHFQLLLAPIFLWGYFLSGRQPDRDFWLAFLAFHVFLFGGTTAFNSYYDRDEGPVGGLQNPPPVSKALLPFSLIVQLLGAGLAFAVNLPLFIIYLLICVMGAAYSHPTVRLKSRPLAGLATVAIGQGILDGLGGWVTAIPDLTRIDGLRWLGIVAVALVTTGFYPLTQIYQIEEDLARGDCTYAAWVGPRGAFAFAIIVQSVAAVGLVSVIGYLLGPLNGLIVALFYGVLLIVTIHWASIFDGTRILSNYRRVMRINALTSLGFLGFVSLHLFYTF